MSTFPHWDLTWLLGCPFCLSFTFLWRLKAWLQLEMGHKDCLEVSGHTNPSLRITCTWLNSLPGAGSGRNCFPSSAEWGTVPFPASSVSFYLGNSLPEQNTSLLFPCGCHCSRDWENPTLKLWHILVFISMGLMDLLCLARSPAVAERGTWWLRRDLQDTVLMRFDGGLQWCPWLVPLSLNDVKAYFQTLSTSNCQGLSSPRNLNQVTEFWREEI